MNIRYGFQSGILSALLVFLFPACGHAFKLSPAGTEMEKTLAKKMSSFWERFMISISSKGISHFSEPVHEEISNRVFGCQGDPDVCGNPNQGYASPYLLAGVRWNDDPPFRLLSGEASATTCKDTETIRFSTQPQCWVTLFLDAKEKSQSGKAIDANSSMSLLARSHFGDLQFLHAMASSNDELASETQSRILMWAEFTWGITDGTYSLQTKLADISIPGFARHFGKASWTIQDLFTLGNPPLRPRVKEVALGSLLHLVQDSFAKGHTDRREAAMGTRCSGSPELAPGKIVQFHSYTHQDTDEHAKHDSRNAFSAHFSRDSPNAIDVGLALTKLYDRGAKWNEVRPFLDCVFSIEDPQRKSGPGDGFVRK